MAGAAAAAGHDLAAVLAAAESAAQSVGSMGVASSVCTLPGAQPADPPRSVPPHCVQCCRCDFEPALLSQNFAESKNHLCLQKRSYWSDIQHICDCQVCTFPTFFLLVTYRCGRTGMTYRDPRHLNAIDFAAELGLGKWNWDWASMGSQALPRGLFCPWMPLYRRQVLFLKLRADMKCTGGADSLSLFFSTSSKHASLPCRYWSASHHRRQAT